MAANLFDLSPAGQLNALEARKIDLGFVELRPPATCQNMKPIQSECVAHHPVVVVLRENHPLAARRTIKIAELPEAVYWIAWHREYRSKAPLEYIEIVHKDAPACTELGREPSHSAMAI